MRSMVHSYKKLVIAAAAFLALTVIISGTLMGTTAYLQTHSNQVTNVFSSSTVSCGVEESFDESTGIKRNVKVKNTGDTEAYIRVRLVTYRCKNIDGAQTVIGGETSVPDFNPGSGWTLNRADGCYYYNTPVAAGESTGILINSITLDSYGDGEYQGLEVLAEAIQSTPIEAVRDSWGWTPSGSVN